MSKQVIYHCDVCGEELGGNGYYHDCTILKLKSRTISQSDAEINTRNFDMEIHLCEKHLLQLKKFLKDICDKNNKKMIEFKK